MEYLRALVEAGFRHLDAVSFVSPKAVPQMADSEELLTQLGRLDGVEIIGIVVNEKGAERAIATGAVNTLGFPYSISATFLRRNQNQSLDENEAVLKRIVTRAREADLQMVAYISMAFGNTYGDTWSEGAVAEAVGEIAAAGIDCVSLADTSGVADPERIRRLVTAVTKANSGCEVGVHLHSRPAEASAKILAAYDAGCRRFDSAIGGLGGCPFAQDELVGNIPTEEVLHALDQREVEPPLQQALENVAALNRAIADEFSKR